MKKLKTSDTVREVKTAIRKTKAFTVVLAVFIAVVFGGCWGKKEMDELGIVTITGIDLEEDGSVRMTVHSVQPYGSVRNPADRSFTWIGTATGENIMDAAKNLRSTATKKLVWIHSKIIIVGQDMARYEFEKVMDFLARNREIRYNSYLLVTGGTAFGMLQVPADIQKNLAAELEGIISNADEWSKAYASNIKDFLMAFSCGHSAGITAKVGYYMMEMDTVSTSKEEYRKFALAGKKLPISYIRGSAIFNEKGFTGWFDDYETRGYMWIANKARPGVIVAGTFRQEEVGMESLEAKSKIKFDNSGMQPVIRIKTKVVGKLVEHAASYKVSRKEEIMELESVFAKKIEGEMDSAVRRAKQYGSDIFGFWRYVCAKCPDYRDKLDDEWVKMFRGLKVEYETRVSLERTGMILERVKER